MADRWMGTILEHLLFLGYANAFSLLPAQQRQHGIRFQLLRIASGQLTHGR